MLEDLTAQEKEEVTELLRKTGSEDRDEALEAQRIFAQSLQEPLREGILTGDIIGNIFEPIEFPPGSAVEFPIDLFRPDNADEFTAYTVPSQGAIPHRLVEGDYITVPTFTIANSIDYLLQYAREARWDILARVLEVMEAGFTKKMNDDGWHTLLAAGFDRNIIVNDTNAAQGQFTKRLISLMKLVMRRNAGGNSSSMNRGKLTDLYVSPEAIEDMRNWGIDEVDETTRRQIFVAEDGQLTDVFGVRLNDLDELGEGQEYQDYYENVVVPNGGGQGNGMATNDVEIVVGLDLSKNDSFVMPQRRPLTMHNDPTAHRADMASYYGRTEVGFAALNTTRLLIGSY